MTEQVDRTSAMRRGVVIATVSNYISRGVALLAGFVLTPLLLHRLGTTNYGLWVLVGSVVAYGWLLNVGIQSTITRYVASYRARDQLARAGPVVVTCFWCDVMLGAVAIGIFALLAPLLPNLFQVPEDARVTASWLILIMGIGIGITIPCETGGAVLRGLLRYDLSNLVDIGSTLLNAFGIVAVLLLGGGVIAVVAIALPVNIFSQVASLILIKRAAPELRLDWSTFERGQIRPILNFSWPLLLTQGSTLLQRRSDEIVIAAFLPVSFVTPYSLAHRLTDLCRDLTKQFMGPFLPLASELDAQRDTGRLGVLYLNGTRISLAIYALLAWTVTLLAHPILRLWVGEEFANNTPIVVILSIAGAMQSAEWLATAVLQGMARHRIQGVIASVMALFNIVLSAALIFPLGITGVALGTLVAAAIEFILVMPYAIRVIGVSVGQIISRVIIPTVVPSILMVAVLYPIGVRSEPTSFVSLTVVTAIGMAVFGGSYLMLGPARSEREVCRGIALGTFRMAQAVMRRA